MKQLLVKCICVCYHLLSKFQQTALKLDLLCLIVQKCELKLAREQHRGHPNQLT